MFIVPSLKLSDYLNLAQIYREPVLTALLSRILREVSERLKRKIIRRATGEETVFGPGPAKNSRATAK